MRYLDTTYQQVCTALLNVAKHGGTDHSGDDYLKRAEEAYKTLKETNPSIEQLKEIANSIGYDDDSYAALVESCRR